MVSKTKTRTKKRGRQTRGTKKSKPAKKRSTRKTSTRLTRPKRLSSRGKRSGAKRSHISSVPEQQSELLGQDNPPSMLPSAQNVGSTGLKEESELVPSDTLQEGEIGDQSSDIVDITEDTNTDTSEIV